MATSNRRTVLRGALVVDGTGASGRHADVVVEDDRIVEVGPPAAPPFDGEVVDLDGLVLAPGFIDIHTHYDAQILWDADLTPSNWHGITSVVMGNCGFGIAPTRPEHRETIIRTLENVEGMNADVLARGIDWCFETFPEYLDALDARTKRLNVAVLLGHSPLRTYVLGDAAAERGATAAEVAHMRAIAVKAMQAGALGFATSRVPLHNGANGKPVPSRLASIEEVFSLASALGEVGSGIIQVSGGPDFGVEEYDRLAQHVARPVCFSAIPAEGDGTAAVTLARVKRSTGEVWPQVACRPIVLQVTLMDPFPFGVIEAFRDILAIPREERARRYGDASWRARARSGFDAARRDVRYLSKITVQETDRHADLIDGPTVTDLAEARRIHPIDLLCDISLDDDLRTRFRVVMANDDTEELAELLRDECTVIGLSDAGAHASQLCDAVFATALFRDWVRARRVLTLEEAVHRLTGRPALVFGLVDRGVIRPAAYADLVAFDPERIGYERLERVWDQPTGADRLVGRSTGVEHVWVNGVQIRRYGADLQLPKLGTGRVLRGGG